MPRDSQMVGCRLRGRIRGGRIIGCGLSEKAIRSERTVDFVSRDMEETKTFLSSASQTGPVATRCLKHRVGTNDVGVDESPRTGNRTIHVAFCSEMQDCIRADILEKVSDG